MTTKEDAIIEIISLAKKNGVSAKEITSAMADSKSAKAASETYSVNKLFSYIGGILIFSGISIYIARVWEDLNSAERIIITLGTGFTLFVMAFLALKNPKYERAATPLFLISALMQPLGLFVALYEIFGTSNDPRKYALLVFGVMFIQQLVTFLKVKRASLLFMVLLFGSAVYWLIISLLDIYDDRTATFVYGISILCITYSIDKTPHHTITPIWYFFGSVELLFSAWHIFEDKPLEMLIPAISCFIIYVSTVARSRNVLFMGTISLLGYIGYFTKKHFLDSIGWPIMLILVGLIFFGISSLAFKINKKYISS